VTKDNFKNYFDDNGTLRDNVTANELTFSGEISDVGVNSITLNRTIILRGNNTVLKDISIKIVGTKDTVIDNITINQNNGTEGISIINSTMVTIQNTIINFNAQQSLNAYAINVINTNLITLLDNEITYAGATNGTMINNVISISNSRGANIFGNKINAKLVSSYVNWVEVPGYGWVAYPISEGILIENTEAIHFANNLINVTYNNISGESDTIYSIDFKNSTKATINNNTIISTGYTYIYGLLVSGFNFTISNNTITSTGSYYANGIDIEGPAQGIVDNNTITVKSNSSVYGIYSGMNGQDATVTYINNTVKGNAYNVFGMSLGDVESTVKDNYIDLAGNYTTGLAYRGSKLNLVNNRIVTLSSQEGNESIWEGFGVESVGVKVIKGDASIINNTISGAGIGISLKTNLTSATLEGNFINTISNINKESYGLFAIDIAKLIFNNNTIDYQGATNGTAYNNGVYIYNVTNPVISKNKFDLELVSCPVAWFEVPEGSGNWMSFPISEGIVIASSNGVKFIDNNVTVTLADAFGSFDTIYSVDITSDNAVVANNNIISNGNSYIYGIILSGNNFNVNNNIIESTSAYYANGIDVEGPATGVINKNKFILNSPSSAYPIYAGMNGAPVSVNITDNELNANSYYAVGIEIGGEKALVKNNTINLNGNHTIGIGSKVNNIDIADNEINSNASNKGNASIGDSLGDITTGAKIAGGFANIANNTIKTTGDYAVNLTGTDSIVGENNLTSAKGNGSQAVTANINTTITGENPVNVLISVIQSGYNYKLELKDAYGVVLANKTINITFAGKTSAVVTDANGSAVYKLVASKVGSENLIMQYNGDQFHQGTTVIVPVNINKENSKITAKSATFKAKVKVKKYSVTLKSKSGKAIAKAKVSIKIKKKTYTAKTNAKGKATFKIKKLSKKGKYKSTVTYKGNAIYNASKAKVTIKVK